jgi:UDP-glucuronate decarboxylase
MVHKVIETDLNYITKADLPWSELKNKTILISGASGFLATYLVETLNYLNRVYDYNIKIIGLVRNIESAYKKFKKNEEYKNLTLIQQDVCDATYIDEKIDIIIHAASFATPKVFRDNPVGTITPNIIGTRNLLELGRKNNIECFLYFSTSGVYGFCNQEDYPLKEDSFGSLNPMNLESSYLESKRMGENICIAYKQQYGIPIKVVRPAITYGPGITLNDGRSFADFIYSIVKNKNIELYSDGNAIRNFCYIADATLGFFTVLLKGKAGEAYNIATDHEISIKDLAYYLVDEVFPEKELKVIMKDDPDKNFLRMNFDRTTVDITKAKNLGWQLSFPIKEGFRRVVKSYSE